MNSPFPAFTRLCLPSLLLATALPAAAAPQLRVERIDGSEINRKRHATVWRYGSLLRTVEKQDADLVSLVSGYSPGLVYSDGTSQVVDADTTASCPFGDVKSLATTYGTRPVLKRDGSIQYWISAGLSQPPADLGVVTAIAAGWEHVVALRQDGTVAAWAGSNPNVVPLKVRVPEYLSEVVAVAAGDEFSLALKSNGTVVTWGNVGGSPPTALNQVKQIAAYPNGIMALKTDGSVRVWGSVTSGRNPPAGVGPLSRIAASGSGTAGVRADGSVATWDFSSFTLLPGLGEADEVACGSDCVVATTPQRIESFGEQGKGLPFERTFTIRNTGDQALGLSGLTLTGTVGNDFTLDASQLPASLSAGQTGSFKIIFTPSDLTTKASLLTLESNDPTHPVFRFSVTGKGLNLSPVAADHSASVAEDSPVDIVLPASDPNGDPLSLFPSEQSAGGTLSNFNGNTVRFTPDKDFAGTFSFMYQASDGSLSSEKRSVTITVTAVNDPPFIHFPGDQSVRSSVAGAGAVVPLKISGGDVEDGLVSPVLRVNGQVIGPDHVFPQGVTVVEVTVTDSNGVATIRTFEVRVVEGPCLSLQYPSGRPIRKSGQVLAWGESAYGAVAVPQGLADAMAISGGFRHSVALREDGTVVAWGWNNSGQTAVPADLSDVVAIAAGGSHTLALKSDGTVRIWGASSATSGMPEGLSGVVAIAAGGTHSLALKSDGSVVAWGSDFGGTEVPPGLSDVVGVFAGSGASYAVKGNGSVVAWGRPDQGQLQVPSWLSGVESISSMGYHSIAKRFDGSVVVWGGDANRLLSEIPANAAFACSVSAGGDFNIAALEDGSTSHWGGFVNNSFYPPSIPFGIDMVAAGDEHALGIQYRTEQLSFRMPVTVSTLPRTLKIANPGSSDLQIMGLSIAGAHPADFTVERSGLPNALAPGASGSFEIRFLPTALGQREATLLIQTNDPLSPSRSIKLTGTWKNAAPVASALSGLVVDEDAPDGLEITLPATDVNGQALTYSIVAPPSAIAGMLGPVIGNKVVFTPALDYHGSASFTFKANDGFSDSNVAPVNLSIQSVEDAPRLTIPASPLVIQTLDGVGSIVDFLVDAFDPEDGGISFIVTRNGVPVSSGDFFPLGDTLVEVTATDSGGRTTTGSFVVRVVPGPDMIVEQDGVEIARNSLITGWGANSAGQLTPPPGLGSLTAIAAGYEHSLALKPDGTVVAWGSNANGKATVPAGLSGVVQIAAGIQHSVALKSDGTVVVWGSGDSDLQPPAGLPPVKAISSLRGHIVALCQDGSVVAWGDNSYGQTTIPSGLGEVVEVAAGGYHCVALRKNGTVVTWGKSLHGLSPVPSGLTGVKSVRCGNEHTLALKKDGTVVAWGLDSDGQTSVPAGLSGVSAITAGTSHSIALKSDGALVAWGSDSNNQSTVPSSLGKARLISANGQHSLVYADEISPMGFASVNRSNPVTKVFTIRNQGPGMLEIGGFTLSGADASSFQLQTDGADPLLGTGESTTFALNFAPGRNGAHSARLRINTNDTTRPEWDIALSGHGFNGSPVTPALTGLSTPEDIALFISLPATDPESDPLAFTFGPVVPSNAGTIGTPVGKNFLFTPAANFNGPVSFIYRANDGGTISEGTVSLVVTPVNDSPVMSYLPGLVRVFSPNQAGAEVNFRLPVISDPEDGSIPPIMTIAGQPFTSGSILAPGSYTVSVNAADSTGIPVSGSFPISVVGTTGASARLEDGSGTKLPRPSPIIEWDRSGLVSVASQGVSPDLRGVKQIAAGDDHVVVLRNDGTLSGWGASTLNRLSIPSDLTSAIAIAAGTSHTLALRSNGTVAAWGNNSSGQCNVPAGLSGITAVAAGGNTSMALRSNGTVVVWGSGGGFPPPSPGLAGVTAIAAGQSYCIALKSDGTVVSWGFPPASVPFGLGGVIAIAAGSYHSVALKSDGKVVAWGSPGFAQTVVPANLAGVTAISAGNYHSMALKQDGTLAAWGSYIENVRILSVPASVKNVVAMDGGYGRLSAVVDSPYSLDLGKAASGSPVTKNVRIHNRGTAPLVIGGIERLGGSSTYISHSVQGMSSSVPVGGSTTFTITFTPSGLGSETARFRITSNDAFEPAMDLAVTAEAATPYAAWAHGAGLMGDDASSDAEPFDDGLINLVKFAFNMDGSRQDNRVMVPGTGTSGLPHISVEGDGDHSFLRVEFLRRRSGAVSYDVQTTPNLLQEFQGVTISPDVFPIDDEWDRVIVRKPFDPAVEPMGFARVRVY